MARDSRVSLLAQVGLFSDCSKKELQKLAGLVELVEAVPGEVLTREGQPGQELFVIQTGSASVSVRGKQVAKLYAGDVIGEMALLETEPRAATVKAETPMTLVSLGPRELSTVLNEVPQIGRKMLKVLATRLRQVHSAPSL